MNSLAAYNELVQVFILYAEHHSTCQRWTHMHKRSAGLDKRAVCEAMPCNCGLVEQLTKYNPAMHYVLPCPDDKGKVVPLRPSPKDITVYPHTLWGIPVFESDDVPEGHIRVGDQDFEVTDADTGNPVPTGLRPVYGISPLTEMMKQTPPNDEWNTGWCPWLNEATCMSYRKLIGLGPCSKKHRVPSAPKTD